MLYVLFDYFSVYVLYTATTNPIILYCNTWFFRVCIEWLINACVFLWGSNLKGKEFNLIMHWLIMPKTGKMFASKIVMTGYRVPEQYR
jgi:hypothetical protein